MSRIDQQGFLTIAQNTDVNYLELAYVQAMSIKLTMPGSKYAVLVDANTQSQIEDKHRRVFDYVIPFGTDFAEQDAWKFRNEWQTFHLTPFKETIKIESDIVFTRSIAHWWTTFRLRDIVLSQGCKDYRGQLSDNRAYRQLFDDNELPDVYNGLMYFRYSPDASEFFWWAKTVFENWNHVRDNLLVKCRDQEPTTDVVYALAAKIVGAERCTIPGVDFINFTHMKPAINNFSNDVEWSQLVVSELDPPMLRINNLNQYHPVHYQDKNWVTTDIVEKYERELARRI